MELCSTWIPMTSVPTVITERVTSCCCTVMLMRPITHDDSSWIGLGHCTRQAVSSTADENFASHGQYFTYHAIPGGIVRHPSMCTAQVTPYAMLYRAETFEAMGLLPFRCTAWEGHRSLLTILCQSIAKQIQRWRRSSDYIHQCEIIILLITPL